MDQKQQDLISINQYIKPKYFKFTFEGVNRVQRSFNNTFVSCVWDYPQFFSLVLMDHQGLRLSTLKLSTNFIPQFRMVGAERVIVLSRQRQASYLILWNIITNQQFKLKLSFNFSSKCEIHIFSTTNKLCLVDKNKEKKQFIVQYFHVNNSSIKTSSSLNRKYKDQKTKCSKINQESGLVFYDKQFKQPSQPLQINKIDDEGTDLNIGINANTMSQNLSYMINDLWQIKQNIYYIQILSKNATQNLFKSFYWDNFNQTFTFATKLLNNSPHLFYFVGSNRQLEIPSLKFKNITILFIKFDSQERVVGYFILPIAKQTEQLIYWPSFSLNQMIFQSIDYSSRQINIVEWQFPFDWRINPQMLAVFLLEGQNQKWDQSLVQKVADILQNAQNSVKFLLQ